MTISGNVKFPVSRQFIRRSSCMTYRIQCAITWRIIIKCSKILQLENMKRKTCRSTATNQNFRASIITVTPGVTIQVLIRRKVLINHSRVDFQSLKSTLSKAQPFSPIHWAMRTMDSRFGNALGLWHPQCHNLKREYLVLTSRGMWMRRNDFNRQTHA